MQTVKVRNTQARLVNIMDPGPMIMGADGKSKRSPSVNVRTLKPGVNLVPKETVEFNRSNVVFKHLEDTGAIVVEEEVGEDIAKSVASMKPADAVKLVQQTLDVVLLERWQSDPATSPKVLAAIATQLEKIESMGPQKPKE